MTDKPQIEKFREAARKLECDESEEAFERKLRKLAKAEGRSEDKNETQT